MNGKVVACDLKVFDIDKLSTLDRAMQKAINEITALRSTPAHLHIIRLHARTRAYQVRNCARLEQG